MEGQDMKTVFEDVDNQVEAQGYENASVFKIDEDLRNKLLEMAMQIYAVRGGELVKKSNRLFDTEDAITAACMMLTQINNDNFLTERLKDASERVGLPMFLQSIGE